MHMQCFLYSLGSRSLRQWRLAGIVTIVMMQQKSLEFLAKYFSGCGMHIFPLWGPGMWQTLMILKTVKGKKKIKEQRGHWPLSGLRRMRKHSIIMWRQSLFAVFQDHAHNKNYISHRKHGCHSSTPTAGCHPGQSHLHVWCHRIA